MNDWLMKELRRVHYKWLPRKNAYKAARVSRGKYVCAHCGEIFPPKMIQLDHREPVINPLTGFTDWNEYVERLFCPQSNYDALCKPCHQIKTQEENKVRRQVKNEKNK